MYVESTLYYTISYNRFTKAYTIVTDNCMWYTELCNTKRAIENNFKRYTDSDFIVATTDIDEIPRLAKELKSFCETTVKNQSVDTISSDTFTWNTQ